MPPAPSRRGSAPAVPLGLRATYATSTSVTLTWDDTVASPAQTPTTYSVWYTLTPGDVTSWSLAAPPIQYGAGRDNYVDLVDMRPATLYYFRLQATNPFGHAVSSPILPFFTTTYAAAP